MNLRQISELIIEAFAGGKRDEEYFYVIADALEDIGDTVNANRFRRGQWDITDYWTAIEDVDGEILNKIRKGPRSTLVETLQSIAHKKYLIEYILKFNYCELARIFCDPIQTSQYIGPAARAMVELGMYSGYRSTWITAKYRECIELGLYKEAKKWRQMGQSWWTWKVA